MIFYSVLMCSVLVFSTVSNSYLRFPYLRISSMYIRTYVFRTCIFHTCKMSCFVLRFSVLVFSNTCDFSAPLRATSTNTTHVVIIVIIIIHSLNKSSSIAEMAAQCITRPFFAVETVHLSLMRSSSVISDVTINHILRKSRFVGLHFCVRQ